MTVDVKYYYPELVEHDAPMNAQTEYWEEDGAKLQNGMRVLVADPEYRGILSQVNQLLLPGVLAYNRWCTVAKFEESGGFIQFLGRYDDGTLVPRRYSPTVGWLVKRNSVPASIERREEVLAVVVEVLAAKNQTYDDDVKTANEKTDEIMKIFGEDQK